VANVYFAFASKQPAVYEAKFALRPELRFADSESSLKCAPLSRHSLLFSETFLRGWRGSERNPLSGLHGLVELERTGA
jgi:predicted TPR repeat methyltransferase